MISKSAVQKVMVVRPAVAVPAAGARLYNASTNVINLGVGGFGAYLDTAGSGNPTAINSATWSGERFRFIQRRDTSTITAPLPMRQFEMSSQIDGTCRQHLYIAGQGSSTGAVASNLIGNPNAATSAKIPVASNELYSLNVAARGSRLDLYFSQYNTAVIKGTFNAPDWTTSGIAAENDRRDYIVKSLVRDFNRKSTSGNNRFALAIAIDSASVTVTGPTIASIIAGGVGANVIIGYDRNCAPVNMLVTADRLAALTNLEAALTTATVSGGYGLAAGTASIARYAFADDCPNGGVEIAGDSTAEADMIFLMAIDETQAYYDDMPATRTNLDAGLQPGSQVTAVRSTVINRGNEGEGTSRQVRLMYESSEEYGTYPSSKAWGANHVAYPNEVLANEIYDIYMIGSCLNRYGNSGMPTVEPHLTAIALVDTTRAVGVSPFSTGAANPQKTYLEAVLNAVNAYYDIPGPINL